MKYISSQITFFSVSRDLKIEKLQIFTLKCQKMSDDTNPKSSSYGGLFLNLASREPKSTSRRNSVDSKRLSHDSKENVRSSIHDRVEHTRSRRNSDEDRRHYYPGWEPKWGTDDSKYDRQGYLKHPPDFPGVPLGPTPEIDRYGHKIKRINDQIYIDQNTRFVWHVGWNPWVTRPEKCLTSALIKDDLKLLDKVKKTAAEHKNKSRGKNKVLGHIQKHPFFHHKYQSSKELVYCHFKQTCFEDPDTKKMKNLPYDQVKVEAYILRNWLSNIACWKNERYIFEKAYQKHHQENGNQTPLHYLGYDSLKIQEDRFKLKTQTPEEYGKIADQVRLTSKIKAFSSDEEDELPPIKKPRLAEIGLNFDEERPVVEASTISTVESDGGFC